MTTPFDAQAAAPVDPQRPLAGRAVVVVEDEALVAMYIEEILLDLGAAAVHLASTVETGLALLERAAPQFAVLDLNLAGRASYPIAQRLDTLSVPYLFLTGYGADGVDPAWRSRPIVQKPATFDILRKAIVGALRPL